MKVKNPEKFNQLSKNQKIFVEYVNKIFTELYEHILYHQNYISDEKYKKSDKNIKDLLNIASYFKKYNTDKQKIDFILCP